MLQEPIGSEYSRHGNLRRQRSSLWLTQPIQPTYLTSQGVFSENHLVETDYLIVIIMKTHKGGDDRELSVYTIILLFYKETYSRRGNLIFDIKSDGLNFLRYRSGLPTTHRGR